MMVDLHGICLSLLAIAAFCFTCSYAFDISGPKVTVQNVIKNPSYVGQVKPFEEPFLEILKHLTSDEQARKNAKVLFDEQDSYDFNVHLSTTDILYRSGFSYELYNSTSWDGYVTQLVRIVNPLIDRTTLKSPPIVLYAGQGASPAVFLMTSIGRGHPIAWPHGLDKWAQNGMEGNRSLAFTLANNGYDVWLVPARGVDAANRARDSRPVKFGSLIENILNSSKHNHSTSLAATFDRKNLKSFVDDIEANHYWSFSDDEIIKYEFGIQLATIMEKSACQRLSVINYSNGGFITFGFMALEQEFAQKHLEMVISIAPAVFVDKFNLLLGATGLLSQLTPPSWPFPEDKIDSVARKGFSFFCKSKALRYSICKLLLNQLYGHSDMFSTFLELGIFDYIGRPLSARGLKQTLQASHSGQMKQFDMGPLGNYIEYDTTKAPVYELAAIKHHRMFIISGAKDAIVSEKSVTKLIGELRACKPEKWINIPGYNHLDLLAGFDNSERVNLPILSILDDRSLDLDYYNENKQHQTAPISQPSEQEFERHEVDTDQQQIKEQDLDGVEEAASYLGNEARSAERIPLRLTGYQNGFNKAGGYKVSQYDDQTLANNRQQSMFRVSKRVTPAGSEASKVGH